jgi:hypothetical protein
MKPPFKISWEEVTPAKAKEWLAKFNSGNRNMRSVTVDSFASDMLKGHWSQNHQAIAFGLDGKLKDGQHRLAGIVRSGVSIWFLICRDVPDRIEGSKAKVMDTIDRGNSRSVADVLKLSHGYKVDANMISAACGAIATLSVSNPFVRVRKLSVSTVLSIVERYKKGLQFASENRPVTLRLRSSPICGAIAFAYAVSPKKTEDFFIPFATGVGLAAESPTLILRNYIMNELVSSRGSQRERFDLAEAVLHTLYCIIEKKPMPRSPRPGLRGGADWFRKQQPENIKFLEALFPSLDLAAAPEPIVGPKNFKLTPAAEVLLRGKEMSERATRKTARIAIG